MFSLRVTLTRVRVTHFIPSPLKLYSLALFEMKSSERHSVQKTMDTNEWPKRKEGETDFGMQSNS